MHRGDPFTESRTLPDGSTLQTLHASGLAVAIPLIAESTPIGSFDNMTNGHLARETKSPRSAEEVALLFELGRFLLSRGGGGEEFEFSSLVIT